MFKIDGDVQKTLWKIGDSLAKYLRSSDNGTSGDPRWTVSPLATRAWKVNHPDLPLVKDEGGDLKETLLQLHVEPVTSGGNVGSGGWLVVAQNKLISPETHAAPKAVIVAKEDQPPGNSWDTEAIGQAAANFFKQQKEELVKAAQSLQSPAQPGSGAESSPQGMGLGGMPVASGRLRRVAGRIDAKASVPVPPRSPEWRFCLQGLKRSLPRGLRFKAFACGARGENFQTAALVAKEGENALVLSEQDGHGNVSDQTYFRVRQLGQLLDMAHRGAGGYGYLIDTILDSLGVEVEEELTAEAP